MNVAARATALVLVAVVLQTAWFSNFALGAGNADLVLVTVVMIALLRGSFFGAWIGFGAGLAFDVATYGTLGLSSLLLTLAGYWTGRYGETSARDRTHAPFLAIAVITVAYAALALVFHFLLGDAAPAGLVLTDALPGQIILNLILTAPAYWLVGKVLGRREEKALEVRLIS